MEEKERLPGLTIKALIVGVLVIVLVAGWYSIAGLVGHVSWYPTWTGDQGEIIFYGFMFMLIMLLALLNQAKIFTAQEVAVITIMFYTGVAFTIFGVPHEMINNPIIKQFVSGMGVAIVYPEVLPYVDPMVWGPIRDADTAVQVLTQSSMNVPWGLWAPTMAWTMLYWGSAAFMGVSVAILLRHWWTRVEGMPFPLAGIHMDLVNATQKGQPSALKGSTGKYFWLGLLISFLIYIPILYALGVLFPYVPGSPPSYLGPYRIVWTEDFAVFNLIPWCDLFIEPWPWLIGFAYLWPMDCLNGFVLGWAIYHIFFPVLFTSMGWIPPMPFGTDSWTIDVQWMTEFPPQMPAWKHTIEIGTLLAMAVYPAIKNRGTLMKMFSGLTKPVPEMDDEGGILSLRTGWIILIVSTVLFIVAWVAAGVPIWYALILTLFVVLILNIGKARIAGETPGRYGAFGFHNHFNEMSPPSIMMFGASGMVGQASTGATFTSYFTVCWPQDHARLPSMMSGWICGPLVGFSLADQAGVKLSDMAKAAIIAVVTWLIVTVLASVIWLYAWPFPEGSPGYSNTTGWMADLLRGKADPDLRSWGYINLPNATEAYGMIGAMGISFIIAMAVYVLRGALTWFAVNPIGIVASIGWDGGDDPSWGTGMIIAWILKALTLRIGGVRFYREKGRPLALGLFFGFTLGYMLHFVFGGLHNLQIYGNLFPT